MELGTLGTASCDNCWKDLDHLHSITIYDNLSRKNYSLFTEAQFDHKPVRFIYGDILDGRSLSLALEDTDCVIHLAAKVTTPFADSEAHFYDQVNHWGTAQLVSAIEDSDVKRVVYLSSMSVYGSHELPVDETSSLEPHSFYGISKYEGEKQMDLLGEREVYIIRSGNVYGYNPSYRIDAVINRFMFNANFRGKIQINGSGEQLRSFIHVDKIVRVIIAAVNADVSPGVYNAVEHNMSINDVASKVRNFYPDLDSIHVNFNIRMRDISASLPCKIFNFVELPDTSFEEELDIFKNQFSF